MRRWPVCVTQTIHYSKSFPFFCLKYYTIFTLGIWIIQLSLELWVLEPDLQQSRFSPLTLHPKHTIVMLTVFTLQAFKDAAWFDLEHDYLITKTWERFYFFNLVTICLHSLHGTSVLFGGTTLLNVKAYLTRRQLLAPIEANPSQGLAPRPEEFRDGRMWQNVLLSLFTPASYKGIVHLYPLLGDLLWRM